MPRAEETPPLVAKFRVGDQSDTLIVLLSALPQSLFSSAPCDLRRKAIGERRLPDNHLERQPHDGVFALHLLCGTTGRARAPDRLNW